MNVVVNGPLQECIAGNILTEEDQLLADERLQNGPRRTSAKRIVGACISIAAALYAAMCQVDSSGNLIFCLQKFSEFYRYFSEHIYAYFGLKTGLYAYAIVCLYTSHLLFLPLLVRLTIWMYHRCDYRFHTFMAALRQRDIALYGLVAFRYLILAIKYYVLKAEKRVKRCNNNDYFRTSKSTSLH